MNIQARAGAWFARWVERHPALSLAVGAFVFLITLIPGVWLIIDPGLTDPLGDLSYAGVFLVNLISTSTLVVPVPGITATANVLIVTEGSTDAYPWLVGIAGGTGMAIGEFTAYYAGVFGSHAARTTNYTVPRRIEPAVRRIADFVAMTMRRWGMITLFVLAAIPDPVFELAALSAGSVRMPVRQFFAAVLAGCLVRGVSLAYLGTRLPFLA